ncbi:hypothetical protein H2200_010324 [Cladophialophora chaetospira]|uniref:Ubiquitin-like domain-containing protein n=1 Tax=Cladophialophora chaetospira TaxID=386627 RepID=A0AA38X188_9EURO|nr:hypothetical protein H2200_010324 [Cladophialophora chaetospira]
MDTLICISRPTNFSADLRTCNTVGDLVALLKKEKAELTEGWDKIPFFVDWDGKANGIPLNGPHYNPLAALPDPRPVFLNISSKILPYNVTIVNPNGVLSDNKTLSYTLPMKSCDTISQVKARIEQRTKIPTELQRLSIGKTVARDEDTLFTAIICENKVLDLCIKCLIEFEFCQTTTTVSSHLNELLIHVLERCAHEAGYDLRDLVFGFSKTSGDASHVFTSWLSDRTEHFRAKSVRGTVGENGLWDGDSIQILKMISKRKKDEDDGNDGNVVRKRQGTRIRGHTRFRARSRHESAQLPQHSPFLTLKIPRTQSTQEHNPEALPTLKLSHSRRTPATSTRVDNIQARPRIKLSFG